MHIASKGIDSVPLNACFVLHVSHSTKRTFHITMLLVFRLAESGSAIDLHRNITVNLWKVAVSERGHIRHKSLLIACSAAHVGRASEAATD